MNSAKEQLDAELGRQAAPAKMRQISRAVEKELLRAWSSAETGEAAAEISASLEQAEKGLRELETMFSPPARPAAGELLAQFDVLSERISRGDPGSTPALGHFAARTMKLIALELALARRLHP